MSGLAYYFDFVSMPVLALVLIVFGGATLPDLLNSRATAAQAPS